VVSHLTWIEPMSGLVIIEPEKGEPEIKAVRP
jgi:hypothetical protein